MVQRYRCERCGKTFSESQPLDGIRTDTRQAVKVIAMLCEGVGIRAVARLTELDEKTVLRILESAGQHCAELMDRKIRNLKIESCQCDEIYSFVHCKEGNNKAHRLDWGEQYTFLAVDRQSKLIISYHTAKREPGDADIFMADLNRRINKDCQLTTDGFKGYVPAVRGTFGAQSNFAQETKVYAMRMPMPKRMRHELKPQGVLEVRIRVRSGNPDRALISTSHVERTNLSIRIFNRRFTRLTLGFSKKIENLKLSLALFFAFFNFCRINLAHGKTPAQAAGLTDHQWTIEEMLKAN